MEHKGSELNISDKVMNHVVSTNSSVSSNNTNDDNNECTVREQDRYMPIANVIRIMRKILPPHSKISDEAKETIQECVSEFISFVTGEANERCQYERRKTITAEDVLWAMSKLGFDDYIEPLTVYLHRYREMEGDHRIVAPGVMSVRIAAPGDPTRVLVKRVGHGGNGNDTSGAMANYGGFYFGRYPHQTTQNGYSGLGSTAGGYMLKDPNNNDVGSSASHSCLPTMAGSGGEKENK